MNSLTIRAESAADQVLHFKLYFYHPSEPAAIIFVILFGSAATLHLYQMFRSRTWFMIPFVLGAACEAIGYIGRTISTSENPGPYTLGPFVLQSVLLLVSPALLAASIYMLLGRIVRILEANKLLFIRRTWLTKIFVTGDVICFLCQAGGAGLLSTGNVNDINTGDDIIIAGLFIQVVFFGLFIIAAAVFHRRITKTPTPLAHIRPWRKHMMGLYIVSTLIFVRCIVRCAEYIEGFVGYIITHEAFLYCFDATPMFFAVLTMNWAHPGEVSRYIGQKNADNGGVKEDEPHQLKSLQAEDQTREVQ